MQALHLSHCPLDIAALELIAAAVASSFEEGLRKDKLYLNVVELGSGGLDSRISGSSAAAGSFRQADSVSQECLEQFAEKHKRTLNVKYTNQRRRGASKGDNRGGRGGSTRGASRRGRGYGRANGHGRHGGRPT